MLSSGSSFISQDAPSVIGFNSDMDVFAGVGHECGRNLITIADVGDVLGVSMWATLGVQAYANIARAPLAISIVSDAITLAAAAT
ncbi:hypothetical protein EVJ58_g2808 [Rhodofomes roseus]|uniref:Uncharacterized protein n=1 Tax=Rhodofomes roseus TaxID=34475 RepID=A0A4Y9YPS6_9APHY|nr:hypothetical protein EVJ58_g2808 [Rhodofomes roseus]